MYWFEVISETVIATTLMTLFSYLMGESFQKLFSEPSMLNYVISISRLNLNPELNNILGWLIHYGLGLFFVIPYHVIWHFELLGDDWISGLLLGAISGIIGIIGWMIIFRMPSKEPKVTFSNYYLQLFFAHVVFAEAVVGIHALFK